jgi:hypothetical protein
MGWSIKQTNDRKEEPSTPTNEYTIPENTRATLDCDSNKIQFKSKNASKPKNVSKPPASAPVPQVINNVTNNITNNITNIDARTVVMKEEYATDQMNDYYKARAFEVLTQKPEIRQILSNIQNNERRLIPN